MGLLAAAPLGHELRVESHPPGAEVRVNGRRVGVTPWSGRVPPGATEVDVLPGGAVAPRRRGLVVGGSEPIVLSFVFATPVEGAPPKATQPEPVQPREPPPTKIEQVAPDPSGPRWSAALTAGTGAAFADTGTLRTNVGLELLGRVDLSELFGLDLGVVLTVEEPTAVAFRAGGRVIVGPAFLRLAAQVMVAPRAALGVLPAVGVELRLAGPVALLIEIDPSIWLIPDVLPTIEGRLGAAVTF